MILRPWKLYLDLIPHKYFHRGYWLAIKESNPWYYFFPAKRSYTLPKDSSFYNTLDPGLVKVVKYLHSKNVITTPSCTGHFSDANYYEEVYGRLLTQATKIQNEGILLTNPETKAQYYYRNKNHRLPWNRQEFVGKSLDYQTKGVLGVVDRNKNLYSSLKPFCEVDHNEGITLIYESTKDLKQKTEEWKRITECVMEVI